MAFDFKNFARQLRITDGAWGTEFQKRSMPPGQCPELWNVQRADDVLAVAESYVAAGSEVILTNTFGGNRISLAGHGLAERAGELTAAGVAISRRAAGDACRVFASIGPTGKVVMMEEVPAEAFVQAFAEQARAAEDAGADAIVLETFNELAEMRLALRGVRSACGLPVVASMTFASGPDRCSTMMGERPADLVKLAADEAADAVGANCGCGPDNYVRVAAMLRQAGTLPVWIKANAGLPQVVDGRTSFPMGPEAFAAYLPALMKAGASFVGGCCGTSPAFIAALRSAAPAVGPTA